MGYFRGLGILLGSGVCVVFVVGFLNSGEGSFGKDDDNGLLFFIK